MLNRLKAIGGSTPSSSRYPIGFAQIDTSANLVYSFACLVYRIFKGG